MYSILKGRIIEWMPKIIIHKAEENKHISESIKEFMKRFDVSSALKSSNAVKIRSFSVFMPLSKN